MELYKALCEISGEGNVLKDEPMKMHTESAFMHRRELFYQKRLLLRARRRLQGWNLHRAFRERSAARFV